MTDNTAVIAALEARIAKLEQMPSRLVLENAVDVEMLNSKIDRLMDLMRMQKEWLDEEFVLIHATRRKADILANAYCRIMPERYAEDFGAVDELRAANLASEDQVTE